MISKKSDVIQFFIHVKALYSKYVLDLKEMIFRIVTWSKVKECPWPVVLKNIYSNNNGTYNLYVFSQVYIHVYNYFGNKDIAFSQIKVQGIKSARLHAAM